MRAKENQEGLRKLLSEREPVFAAMLQAAEQQVDQELSCGT